MTNIITACSVAELLTWVSGWLQLRPASSMVSGHFIRGPKNNLYIPSSVMPRKCWIVRGPSGLNSHIRRGRRLQGWTQRTSITCITITRLKSLSKRSRMRLCNISTSFAGPQISPLLIHDISCGGGPERKAGVAAYFVPRGVVM